jgi:putative peptidoglycan lipid II flippase
LSFARPEPVVRFARLVSSEVMGGAVTRVNPIVDQLVAGFTGVIGGGTLLRLSWEVAGVPTSLVQAALLPALLAHLADDFTAGRRDAFRATLGRALASVVLVLAAASLVLYAARAPLLRFVYERGEMDAAGVDRMIRLMPYHLLGIPPFGALLVLVRAHVAIQNSRIMLGMGLLNAALNVAFDVALLPVLGLEGIALATAAMHAVVALVLWAKLAPHLAERSWA